MKKLLHFWLRPALAAGLVVATVILLTLLAQVLLWKYAVKETVQERFADMDREAFLLGARVRGRANDMFFLKRVAEQELIRNPKAPVAGDNLRSAVTTMMLARSQYDQIRLLDLSGHEIFRYNWKGITQPLQEVPANQLQDKSSRPYFRDTLESPTDVVVFSPLDLNVEQGQIEQPLKPMMRVSGQIVGPDGKTKALLVLNYLGDQFLRELKLDENKSRQTMLLNGDGYWLVGPQPQSEWGFMFPERTSTNLKQVDPAVWNKLTSRKSGHFEEGGNLYCYQKLDPLGTPLDYPPLRMSVKGDTQLRWILLSRVPNDLVWRKVHEIGVGLWLGCAAVVLTLAPMTWIGLNSVRRRRMAMAEMRELTRQAQAAERAKSEFLAIMSHEIRTPMNGVIGMTSILADTELTEIQQDCVNTIHTSGEVLLTVINDILDFSKIESGKMRLEHRAFNLRQCIEEAIDLFVARIREKKLETTYLIAAGVPMDLIGDSNHLRQIFTNLIGNAIKFTEHGEIVIKVDCRQQDEKGYHLVFSVKDTGIGIPKEGVVNLFQPFQQVDTSTTRRYGGTGLGLVISRRLAELMSGTMWVESEPGVGSTFFFTAVLEAAPILGTVGRQEEQTGVAPASVMIVDDNATNRHMLELQLKAWGMSPVSFSTGRDALAAMDGGAYKVGLLDLQMPDMDGVTLAGEMRKRSDVPLILLSSTGDRVEGTAGDLFRYQIFKPIKQSLLLDALKKVLGTDGEARKNGQAVRVFDDTMGARQPLRILLAEDNAINQKVVLKMLAKLGYDADLATNGREVLDAAAASFYDVVLMDIQMPEMGGVEAARLLREKFGAQCPFIVALTAEALEGDRERFLGLGFEGYLSKPLRPEELRQMLEAVVNRK